MSNTPWLDNLSDDWVLEPGTPASPVPARSLNHSRQPSLQSLQSVPNSPSRIPVPARRSVEPSPRDKKKVSRPCHFVKREPPTPKTPRAPKTPSKLRTPAPDRSKKSSHTDRRSSARRRQSSMDTRSPLRSVSNASTQSVQHNTVQVKHKKGKSKQGTPEWRRRLVRGEIPAGEQRDLFAPIGLESVFKPPTPGTEKTQGEIIPKMKPTDELWSFTKPSEPKPGTDGETLLPDQDADGIPAEDSHIQVSGGLGNIQPQEEEARSTSPQGSPSGTLNVKKGSERPQLGHSFVTTSLEGTQLRSASGLEDIRNEGITPITFTRTNTVEGNGTSEVIRSALKQVTSKLQKLSLPPWERPGSRASDSIVVDQQTETAIEPPDDDIFDVTSHSLPQDLSMGTLDYRGRGVFGNLHCEQPSTESSFQKQQLSPSLPSHRLSPLFYANSRIRSSPPFYQRANPVADPPTLPRPSSAHMNAHGGREDRGEAMPSTGSPLKLFGNHDTFTNNKLLRRMSQFEETLGDSSENEEPVSPSETARRKGEHRSSVSTKHDTFSEHSMRRSERPRSRNTPSARISRFGDGQLDHFDFADTSPYGSKQLQNAVLDGDVYPSSRRRRYLRRPSRRDFSRRSDLNSLHPNDMTSSKPRPMGSFRSQEPLPDTEFEQTGLEWNPNSPAKDPITKRRRTHGITHNTVEEHGEVEVSGQTTSSLSLLQKNLMQQGMHFDGDSLLHPQSSERPRTPTPSQTRSSIRKRSSPSKNEPDVIYNGTEDEDSPAGATVPVVRVTGASEEHRKPSITTQDFLNEATKIMDIIRSNGMAAGDLSSVEESEEEEKAESDSYEDESTREEFSRPPSREGVDMRKLREPKEPNPRILSHLKKFQEHDDMRFGDNTSVTSLDFENDGDPVPEPEEGVAPGQDAEGGFEKAPEEADRGDSDFDERERKSSVPTSGEDDDLPDLLTFNTNISSKSQSTRSVPTGSSQSSHAKGVLSSDLVSHLIPEQVNGLTYDRYKHQWVREKPEAPPEKRKADESEDDPFQDIPDLSVDELQEMMRMQNSASPGRMKDSVLVDDDSVKSPLSKEATLPELVRQPSPKDTKLSVASLSQSKDARPPSRDQASRATEGQENKTSSSEVEHEIQLHEGRLSKPPRGQMQRNQQARVVTISFSSPLVSQVAYGGDESPSKLRKTRAAGSKQAQTVDDGLSGRPQRKRSCLVPGDHQPASSSHTISRIDEQGEHAMDGLSLVRLNQESEQTLLKPYTENSLIPLHNMGNDTSYSFHLDTLPDFTVHQMDQSIHPELSYVAQRTQPTSLRQVHGTFALATEALVKHITEAEPFEPYWEHVRRLVLRHKGLITLHKLSDFCPRLEDLDVSNNNIGHLSGVPATLRTLTIPQNCLSNLTAWGHLVNLQYLDVSGNELESLDGFSSLIHLRELNANDNNIRDIEGVFELDGLLSLKLSNNSLTTVDFGCSELTRLEELDLSHNQLISVRNLESLPALSDLNLSSNQLAEVAPSISLSRLLYLRLSNNQLHSFDAGAFPSLSLLYLDQNYLFTIANLEQCQRLEILSAREQMIAGDHDEALFDVDLGLVKDARKIFLSSNKLSIQCLSPSSPLSGLQLLDVASCHIESLPADFALSFPNVRVLNLNFNSLNGISELAGLNCLSRLTLAGNSVSRLRRLCQVLSRIGRTNKAKVSTLQKVDVRGNPLTVRFYPPAVTGNGKADDTKRLSTQDVHNQQEQVGVDVQSVLAEFRHSENVEHSIIDFTDEGPISEKEVDINDPYTLPLADPQADQKYLSHLDEPTRLRRRVFELMLYAGTGGSLKLLDGLQLRPTLDQGSDMDHAWKKLEKLGVLKRKAITE